MQTFLTTSSQTILSLSSFTSFSLSDSSRTDSDIIDEKSNMPSFASMSLISFLKKPLLIYLNSCTCSVVSDLLKFKNNSLQALHCRLLTFVKVFVVFLAKKSQRMVFLALFCLIIYPYFLSKVITLYTSFAFLF